MNLPPFPPSLRVGLCHDWLTGMRGGERVLELLCQSFPDAPLYTLLQNPAAVSAAINAHPIRTTPLQRIPGIATRYRGFLPLMPWMVNHWKPPADLDLLISTSHCVAKSIRVAPGTRHLSYCFTPMRYAWLFHEEYFPHPLKRAALSPLLAGLRRWDRRTAARVDHFIAISRHVQDRIRRFYDRDADVVYPPADTAFFQPAADRAADYDFLISALVPYKKVDLAVRAYTRAGLPLKIMGSGSGLDALQAIAGPSIEFLGRQPDDVLRHHYQQCRFLLFPGEEDYGIVPVEAMACGTPVIAYGRGGATETVVDRVTGVFFTEQTETALLEAVETAAALPWDRAAIRARAERFSTAAFLDGLAAVVHTQLSA